jgi:hypothetical protein
MVKLLSWHKKLRTKSCLILLYAVIELIIFVCDLYTLTFLLYLQIEIKEIDGVCPSPSDMAGQVVTYLEEKGFLHE